MNVAFTSLEYIPGHLPAVLCPEASYILTTVFKKFVNVSSTALFLYLNTALHLNSLLLSICIYVFLSVDNLHIYIQRSSLLLTYLIGVCFLFYK
jgi:hypothetical protein